MKTKQQLIEKIYHRFKDKDDMSLTCILEEELPDFNPNLIDEEMMREIFNQFFLNVSEYDKSVFATIVNNYNSTVSKGLKPLPSAEEFGDELLKCFENNYSTNDLVDYLISKYELPTKKSLPEGLRELPDVQDLKIEIQTLWQENIGFRKVAEHLHSKYGTQPREWWQDLKEGDKFMYNTEVVIYHNTNIYLYGKNDVGYNIIECTPYTAPTADEIIKKHNLTEEEVRVIREGKC